LGLQPATAIRHQPDSDRTRAPFNPANADATNGGRSLPDILLRTKFRGSAASTATTISGIPTITPDRFGAAALLARPGVWMAYTFSKSLGTTGFNPVVPDNEAWNYGRTGADRRHNFQFNYTYDFPTSASGLGRSSLV